MNPKFRRHFKLSILQLNRFCCLVAHSRSCENDGACTGEGRELKLSAFWVLGSVSSALIILAAMCFSQFGENCALVDLHGVYFICICGFMQEEK